MAETYDMDGSVTRSISERMEKKKKPNPLLDFFEKRLSNPDNVAPAAKFIQKKKQRNQMIKDMLK